MNKCENRNNDNHQFVWELLKMKIRSLTVGYSIIKSKQRKEKYKIIEREILQLEQEMNNCPNQENLERIQVKNDELETERKKVMESVMFRSKAEWLEFGERNSEYFCRLEKRKFVNKTIYELIDENGSSITKQDDILNKQETFFKKLYESSNKSSENDDYSINEFLIDNPKLTEEDKMSCEGELTLEECGKALRNMANKKSPGSDGYTTEFYNFFLAGYW